LDILRLAGRTPLTEDSLPQGHRDWADQSFPHINPAYRYDWYAEYLNKGTALLVLKERFSGGGASAGLGLMYDMFKSLNPVHFAFETGWIIGSGENLLGQERDRLAAVVEFGLYLAMIKATDLIGKGISKFIEAEPRVPPDLLPTEPPPPPQGPYGQVQGNLPRGVQANHLNQDAAFRNVIPREQGAAVGLRGNAITEVGSPHYKFHRSLEGFWEQFRKGGTRFGEVPTIREYNVALGEALKASGLTHRQSKLFTDLARFNQKRFGLTESDLVPRLPGRMGQKK